MQITELLMRKARRVALRCWDAYDPSTADQADPYLIAAVQKLQAGASITSVADFVVEAEIDRLGLDTGDGIRERAAELVLALNSELPRH